ncbi:DUF6194 family protein [Nocardia halotolerans]|uniref:DUF6194 family protein n=1 Tax=Nocardia halotolerans TaxID=1755878 RepID=A0ABV8VPL3_9NOCA
MTIAEITEYVSTLGAVLTVTPEAGSEWPPISWGDTFFYYAPDGVVPKTQPFATITTKNYPGEPAAGLDRPGAFRVNIAAGKDAFATWAGRAPADDTLIAHPTYAAAHWLAVVNPGERTTGTVRELLRTAHDRARIRFDRRAHAE